MVFERISLIQIYDALKVVNENEGRVSQILINRDVKYGTKTFPRFRDLAHLRQFINQQYPYMAWEPDCECVTCSESVCRLLNFTIQEATSYDIFVNNIRKDYESAKELRMNQTSVKALRALFKSNLQVERAYDFFTCFPYVEPQEEYLTFEDNPEDCYIQIVTNPVYDQLIQDVYKPTLRSDFPTISRRPCPQIFIDIPLVPEDGCFGFRLTTLSQGDVEDPESSGSALIKIEQCDPDQPIQIISVATGQPVILPPEYETTQDGTTQFILEGLPVGAYTVVVGTEDFACLSQSSFFINYNQCYNFELSINSTDEGDCDQVKINIEVLNPASTDQSQDGRAAITVSGGEPTCDVELIDLNTTEVLFTGQFDQLSFVLEDLPGGTYQIETIDGQYCQVSTIFEIPIESLCEGFSVNVSSIDETGPTA